MVIEMYEDVIAFRMLILKDTDFCELSQHLRCIKVSFQMSRRKRLYISQFRKPVSYDSVYKRIRHFVYTRLLPYPPELEPPDLIWRRIQAVRLPARRSWP